MIVTLEQFRASLETIKTMPMANLLFIANAYGIETSRDRKVLERRLTSPDSILEKSKIELTKGSIIEYLMVDLEVEKFFEMMLAARIKPNDDKGVCVDALFDYLTSDMCDIDWHNLSKKRGEWTKFATREELQKELKSKMDFSVFFWHRKYMPGVLVNRFNYLKRRWAESEGIVDMRDILEKGIQEARDMFKLSFINHDNFDKIESPEGIAYYDSYFWTVSDFSELDDGTKKDLRSIIFATMGIDDYNEIQDLIDEIKAGKEFEWEITSPAFRKCCLDFITSTTKKWKLKYHAKKKKEKTVMEEGNWEKLPIPALKKLCRENLIYHDSKIKKADLVQLFSSCIESKRWKDAKVTSISLTEDQEKKRGVEKELILVWRLGDEVLVKYLEKMNLSKIKKYLKNHSKAPDLGDMKTKKALLPLMLELVPNLATESEI